MKKLILISLLGLMACQPDNPQPDNPQPNTSTKNGNYIQCTETDNIPWKPKPYGTVKDVDGNIYKTVKIGNQRWMAENLKTTHYANGDEIPFITIKNLNEEEWQYDSLWWNTTSGAYCWNLSINDNGDTISYEDCYGGLYNFYTIEDDRNVCPTGWHVPSKDEWIVLTDHISNDGLFSSDGGPLQSISGWTSKGGVNGTDKYGFRALPGGVRYPSLNQNIRADFWSSTDEGYMKLYYCYISDKNFISIYGDMGDKTNGLSIRCIKD